MKKIALISCVSKKLSSKAKAQDLYISPLFRYSLKFARSLNPDKIFILSAKHGLLDLNNEIAPYNLTLNEMASEQIEIWASRVLKQLRNKTDLDKDRFIFLAGKEYRKYLTPHIRYYEIPLEGLKIGEQLKYLKSIIGKISN